MSMTSGHLAIMRGHVNRIAYPDVCTVKTRPAGAPAAVTADGAPDDGDAGWTGATVNCRVAPSGGDTKVIGLKRAAEADKMMSFPVGTAIKPYDRVVFGGVKYEVIEVTDPRSWALSVRTLVKVVK